MGEASLAHASAISLEGELASDATGLHHGASKLGDHACMDGKGKAMDHIFGKEGGGGVFICLGGLVVAPSQLGSELVLPLLVSEVLDNVVGHALGEVLAEGREQWVCSKKGFQGEQGSELGAWGQGAGGVTGKQCSQVEVAGRQCLGVVCQGSWACLEAQGGLGWWGCC